MNQAEIDAAELLRETPQPYNLGAGADTGAIHSTMSIPFDQTLAKLRILERRAREEAERARKEFERKKREIWQPVYEANERHARCSSAYMARARELGYCGSCEKPLGECQCVALASSSDQPNE